MTRDVMWKGTVDGVWRTVDCGLRYVEGGRTSRDGVGYRLEANKQHGCAAGCNRTLLAPMTFPHSAKPGRGVSRWVGAVTTKLSRSERVYPAEVRKLGGYRYGLLQLPTNHSGCEGRTGH